MVSRAAPVLICLVLAGCSTGAESQDLTIEDLLTPSESQQQALVTVEDMRRDCMAKDGFTYVPYVQPQRSVSSAVAQFRSALITADEREWVATYGYGLTIATQEPLDVLLDDPNRRVFDALPREQWQAYNESFGRCAIEAYDSVGFDDRVFELSRELNRLLSELEGEILADARLDPSTALWSECMAEQGYRYDRLSQPRDEFSALLTSMEFGEDRAADVAAFARLLQDEVTLALDDLDCRVEASVSSALPDVIADVERSFIDRNRDLLEEIQSSRLG